MRIYFYHTQDIQYILSEHEKGHFPGHMLYGATYLEKMGFDIVWHQFIPGASRLKRMLTTSWRILKLGRSIDAVYATHYTGIEPIIFLQGTAYLQKTGDNMASPACDTSEKQVTGYPRQAFLSRH